MNDNMQERIAHNADILPQLNAAITSGDELTAQALLSKLRLPAVSLLILEEAFGKEAVAELDTSEAERVFGRDWMEGDHDKHADKLHV